jgi:hypothetical protein
MLRAFDPELAGSLMEKLVELGIAVRTRSTVQWVHESLGWLRRRQRVRRLRYGRARASADTHDLTAEDLKNTLFAYPSSASDVRQMIY